MINKTKPLFLASAILCANAALADAESSVDEIIVSGALVPVTVSEIGNAVTVISSEDIARRQALNVADLLRSVPGFAVSRSGVRGTQTQVRVRGAEANQVLVLIDGNRVNDPSVGDEFRWELLSTAQIERIEIVRGAQSALWGTDAIGGVVNIISRGGTDGSLINGFAETGSRASQNFGLDGSIGTDSGFVAAGAERQSTDGDNISRAGDEDDGSSLNTAFINGRWLASDRITLDGGVRLSNAYSEFDGVDFSTGIPGDSDTANDSETLTANLGARWQHPDDVYTHRISARWFDSELRTLNGGIESASTRADRMTLAYQFDLNLGENGLSLAVEHEASDFSQRGAVIFGDPNQDQSMNITSLIAEYRGFAGDRFSWIASARFDSNSDFDDAYNGRLSASYQIDDQLRLRGNIGTGQKNPTFTERFGFFPGSFVGNPALDPERSLSMEIGLDGDSFDGAVQWQVSLFNQDLEDEINGFVFDPVTFLGTAENRNGKSDRQGGELAAQWQIAAAVRVDATYTYIDATEPDAGGNTIDELRRPRHTGSLGLDVDALEGRWTNRLTAEYGGSRLDRFFPPFPLPSQVVTIGNYWLVDLSSQYAVSESLTVYARGSNLLDEDYEEVFGYETLGRAGFVGVKFSFGR
ncbi:MAG: TonB-dependent receptor plug domain-containing protein [Woeseiaceae bacterium]